MRRISFLPPPTHRIMNPFSIRGIAITALLTTSLHAQVLITQYYEGSGTNKWLEITNIGTADVDLADTGYNLGLWQNANTEGYKNDLAPNITLALTGNLSAGTSLLYSLTITTIPAYATANFTSDTMMSFNGDDSIGLYIGSTYLTGNLADAIGFTDLGAEGTDTSFVRISPEAGWNTVTGSTVLDFATVWSAATLEEVASAVDGTGARLGFSAVSAIPEPSTFTALAALCALAGAAFHRMRRSKAEH